MLFPLCAFSQNADAVINRYFEAVGGRESWKKIESVCKEIYLVKLPSNGIFFQENDTVEKRVNVKFKRPDLFLSESHRENEIVTFAFNGDHFLRSKNGVVEELPIEHGLYFSSGIMVSYPDIFLDSSNVLNYEGIKEINGENYEVIKAKRPSWILPYYYAFDLESGFLSICYREQRDTKTFLSDYKDENGLKFPTVEQFFRNGVTESKSYITSIVVNCDVDSKDFSLYH